MRKRKRPYEDRVWSRTRTVSKKKRAGARCNKPKYNAPKSRTVTPREPHQINWQNSDACAKMGVWPNPFLNPPMNLRSKSASEFMDIETCFHSSSLMRAMSGRAPLARKYT